MTPSPPNPHGQRGRARRGHRRRPRRPHRRLRPRQAGGGHHRRSRPTTSSGASAAPSSATAGASTSAATASSRRSRRVEALWHEILPDEDFMLRPRMSRIYYKGKFYRLPAAGHERPAEPRAHRGPPLRAVLPVGADPPAEGPDALRGLDGGPVRLAPLPDLLQDLHREGVGPARPPSSRPTSPRSGSRTSRSAKAVVERAAPPPEPEGHHLAHRGVRVPEARPRDDVGALPRPRRGAGHQGA